VPNPKGDKRGKGGSAEQQLNIGREAAFKPVGGEKSVKRNVALKKVHPGGGKKRY